VTGACRDGSMRVTFADENTGVNLLADSQLLVGRVLRRRQENECTGACQ
jgi:hypothetical protein